MMLFVSKRGGKVTNIGESNKAKGVNKQHTHIDCFQLLPHTLMTTDS